MQPLKAHRYQQPAILLEQLWPQVKAILENHGVPDEEAEALIQDTLLALLYKWEGIANHEYWLLKTLEQRCRRLYGSQPRG